MLTSSDTRNSNASRSNRVRVPTGSEALTDSIVSGLRDLDTGRPRTDTSLRLENSRTVTVMSTTSHARSPVSVRLSSLLRGHVTPVKRAARNLHIMCGEPIGTFVEVAEKIAMEIPRHLWSQDSIYTGAVCVYMASHLLHRPKSVQEVAGSSSLNQDLIRSLYALLYPIRTQLISVFTWILIAGNRLEGLLALLPPPDGENANLDDGEQQIRELQGQDSCPERHRDETKRLCTNHYDNLGNYYVFRNCIDICESGVLERCLGRPSAHLKVAIGLYIGTNLLGTQVSCQRVADLVGINENALTAAYLRIYPWADQLLRPRLLEDIVRYNNPRAVEPVLTWPPLEV